MLPSIPPLSSRLEVLLGVVQQQIHHFVDGVLLPHDHHTQGFALFAPLTAFWSWRAHARRLSGVAANIFLHALWEERGRS